MALIAVLFGAFLSAGPAHAQETQCPQTRPRDGDLSKRAADYIEEARKQDSPQDARGYIAYALSLLGQGIADEPDNPLHYYMAGQASLELGDYLGADTLWDRAVCLWEPYRETIDGLRFVAWGNALQGGEVLASSGNTLAAMQAYRNAYVIYDREPHPIFQFAVHCVTQAQLVESDSAHRAYWEDAIWGFREAVAAARRSDTVTEEERRELSGNATANLAQLLAFQGRLMEAAGVYEQYLAEYPDDAQARSSLASFLAMRINELRGSVQQTEDPAEKEDLLAAIDSLGERVLNQYAELLAMEEGDLEADEYHDMGIGLYQLDKFEEAAVAFRKALELESYRPQSFELLAHSFYAAENYDSLVTVAEQLVERYPNDVDNLTLLAHAYRETEQPEEALKVLERRQALPFQLTEIDMEGGAASGKVENLKLEPGTPIEIEFIFYDDAGIVIGTGGHSMNAPEEGDREPFRVSPEAPVAEASGFTYRVVRPA
jgi:tetratricopeptide (TPR) repeat protein